MLKYPCPNLDNNVKLKQMKILAKNKKIYSKYHILEKFYGGIVLIGQEVKSIKSGRINLFGSYIVLKRTAETKYPEPYLVGANIPPYQPKNVPMGYDPQRSRKILLRKKEIGYLVGKVQQKGLTLVPLKMYTKKGKIKIEFATAVGLKKVDKRELIKKRETERKIQRTLRRY